MNKHKKFRVFSQVILVSITLSILSRAKEMPFPIERTTHSSEGSLSTGKYFYVGDVPRFASKDLELTASKMGLTLRVKAWVSQPMIEKYPAFLNLRFGHIKKALEDPSFEVVRPKTLAEMKGQSSDSGVSWLNGATLYMNHSLKEWSKDLFDPKQSPSDFKINILTALLRSYSKDTGKNYEVSAESPIPEDPDLFYKHFDKNFTKDSSREGYVGYLTIVYPIAASAEGPFAGAQEGHTTLSTSQMFESRWWSAKWKDVFGGFPFIAFDQSGHAFHGPISLSQENNIWYLRRDFASHGCFRMDPSDILELRHLLGNGNVSLNILNWFDVESVDGSPKVVDVAYYNVRPMSGSFPDLEENQTLKDQIIEQQRTLFQNEHYTSFDRKDADNSFNTSEQKFYKIPKFSKSVVDGSLTRDGSYEEAFLKTYPARQTQILQYREKNIELPNNLDEQDDHNGNYSMSYFQNL